MAQQDPITDSLVTLEQRLQAAVRRVEQFTLEYRAMRARHQQLLTERADLVDKTEAARNRVEGMISRLKNMEQP
ncbi:MAG: TIGR02449 family protein [Immundisolibacter sp.]|uniref:TIGR02449 family protein n=1 Tax=Immundisolibacter sp. TaxID=1934948 RepID=UPI00356332EF